MKYSLKKVLLFFVLVSVILCSGCNFLEYLFGGDITITSPVDGTVVKTSSVTIYVDATYDYIDLIYVEVNGKEVYSTSESSFSYPVSLDPGPNTIDVFCYAYLSEEDTSSSFVGSDSVDVFYDDVDPVITITSPANWSIVQINAGEVVTISGTISDNYGLSSIEYLEDGVYHSISYTGDTLSGTWDLILPNLSEDTYSYAFKVVDLAGRAVISFITFSVDVL